MDKLKELLNTLEENIDVTHINHVRNLLCKNINFEDTGNIMMRVTYPVSDISKYSYKETTEDMAKMLYNELANCAAGIEIKDYSLPMVRANYGVGTLASVFGMESKIVNDNMPWVEHLDDINDVKRLIDKGIPDLKSGFGEKVLETYEFYSAVFEKHPKCKEAIKLYHPDLQGPFDIAHLIMGSEIYMALYDEPDLVKSLMQLITDTYILYMKKLKPYLNDEFDNYNYHWSSLYGGKILLRDDSAVNLSKASYEEFVKPYNEQILNSFGGGSIHFCGRADQWLFSMADSFMLKTLNFGFMHNVDFGESFLEFCYPVFKQKKVSVNSYVVADHLSEGFNYEKYKLGINFHTGWPDKESALKFLMRLNG